MPYFHPNLLITNLSLPKTKICLKILPNQNPKLCLILLCYPNLAIWWLHLQHLTPQLLLLVLNLHLHAPTELAQTKDCRLPLLFYHYMVINPPLATILHCCVATMILCQKFCFKSCKIGTLN